MSSKIIGWSEVVEMLQKDTRIILSYEYSLVSIVYSDDISLEVSHHFFIVERMDRPFIKYWM